MPRTADRRLHPLLLAQIRRNEMNIRKHLLIVGVAAAPCSSTHAVPQSTTRPPSRKSRRKTLSLTAPSRTSSILSMSAPGRRRTNSQTFPSAPASRPIPPGTGFSARTRISPSPTVLPGMTKTARKSASPHGTMSRSTTAKRSVSPPCPRMRKSPDTNSSSVRKMQKRQLLRNRRRLP